MPMLKDDPLQANKNTFVTQDVRHHTRVTHRLSPINDKKMNMDSRQNVE